MGILAIVLAIAWIGTGVVALVVSRGLWRALAAITLFINAICVWSMVAIRLAHANPGDPRRSDGWEDVAGWSVLGDVLGVLWAFALAVVAVSCMVQARGNPDAVIGARSRGGWMLGDVLRLTLGHALLTLGQGCSTFLWAAVRLPWG